MTPCDGTPTSEKWCCGALNVSCCMTNPIIIPANFGSNSPSLRASASQAQSSARASGAVSTSISSSSSRSSGTGTAHISNSDSSSPLSGGAIAGIVIGSVIGVAIVFLAGVFFAKKKMLRRRTAPPMQSSDPVPFQEQKTILHCTAEAMDSQIVEAPDTNTRENEERSKIQELP
jgi:hypothetical protein